MGLLIIRLFEKDGSEGSRKRRRGGRRYEEGRRG